MELDKALALIKRNLKKEIIETKHFKEQCLDRNLDIKTIRNVVSGNKILGIVEQDEKEKLYKVWFYYEKNKDLNIVMRILPSGKLKFVTTFPCYSDRRAR